MVPHDIPSLQPDELARLRQETLARMDEIDRQIRAARRREEDLKQQLNDSQSAMAKLGLMQLGKKMLVKAEQDSLRRKLATNRELQETLLAQQQECHETLSALDAQGIQAAPATAGAVSDVSGVTPANAVPAAPAAQPEVAPPAARAAAPGPVRRRRNPPVDAALPDEEQTAQLLNRLEALYPEHQVFAMDSLCGDLRDRLNAAAVRSGCLDLTELLRSHGYEVITGTQGRLLRRGRFCTPGQEPEVIRPLLDGVLRRLEKHYPERIIRRSLQHEHKSLAQDVTALSQWLGYESIAALLSAYGFRYQVAAGGRPATDAQGLLDRLHAAYDARDEKPRTVTQLMNEHPELAHALKTLQNQSPARFGMPLKQYLTEQGILHGRKAGT